MSTIVFVEKHRSLVDGLCQMLSAQHPNDSFLSATALSLREVPSDADIIFVEYHAQENIKRLMSVLREICTKAKVVIWGSELTEKDKFNSLEAGADVVFDRLGSLHDSRAITDLL